MLETKVFREDWAIDSRLADFGVTREELMTIVHAAVGGRADAVPHDPVTTPGVFSYVYGTRALRDLFVPKGLMADNADNIASVYNPITGTKNLK